MAEMTDTRGPENNIALVKDKQKQFNQKVQKAKVQSRENPNGSGVVYLSHLPWGLEEKPLKEYLHQFGTIKQMRISRSKKTGNSKGYGYVKFANDQVAKIVADSMNNYLMFGKLLKCKHLANPHPKTFKNANRRFVKPVTREKSVAKHNAVKSSEAVAKNKKRALSKLKQIQKNLNTLTGLDYQLPCTGEDESQKRKKKTGDEGEPTPKKKKKNPTVEKLPSPETVAAKSINHTPRRLKPEIPRKVDTPQGKLNVLIEDSSDDDISFKTPPYSIKSSKLTDTMTPCTSNKASVRGTSKTPVKGQTPKSARPSRAAKVEATPVPDSTKGPDNGSLSEKTGRQLRTRSETKATPGKGSVKVEPKVQSASKTKLKTPVSSSKRKR